MNPSLPAVLVNEPSRKTENVCSSFKSETAVRNSGSLKGDVL